VTWAWLSSVWSSYRSWRSWRIWRCWWSSSKSFRRCLSHALVTSYSQNRILRIKSNLNNILNILHLSRVRPLLRNDIHQLIKRMINFIYFIVKLIHTLNLLLCFLFLLVLYVFGKDFSFDVGVLLLGRLFKYFLIFFITRVGIGSTFDYALLCIFENCSFDLFLFLIV